MKRRGIQDHPAMDARLGARIALGDPVSVR
jgi:hypothetical protein